MHSGRIYEVFVDGVPVNLIGSTVKSLEQRRRNGYTKRFGLSVELRVVREIPRPAGYSDSDYNFYLKACEARDIARKHTYIETGGLNKISPLIQVLGHPMLEREMGKIGGRASVTSGQLAKIQIIENQRKGGSIAGRKNIESGHLKNIRTLEHQRAAGRVAGLLAVSSGQLARAASAGGRAGGKDGGRKRIELYGNPATPKGREKGNCRLWHINRGASLYMRAAYRTYLTKRLFFSNINRRGQEAKK